MTEKNSNVNFSENVYSENKSNTSSIERKKFTLDLSFSNANYKFKEMDHEKCFSVDANY